MSSREVAAVFYKEHRDVLESIRGIVSEFQSAEFSAHQNDYFLQRSYTDSRNRKQPEFLISKKGFQLLAMGFTGSKAFVWKLKYIEAFEQMEMLLREKLTAEWREARVSGKKVRRYETDVIMEKLIPLAIQQGSRHPEKLYAVYSKLVNEMMNIPAGRRDELPLRYVEVIKAMEILIENVIEDEVGRGTHYKQIYQLCRAKCQILRELSFLPVLELPA